MPIQVLYSAPQTVGREFCVEVTYTEPQAVPFEGQQLTTLATVDAKFTPPNGRPQSLSYDIRPGESYSFCFTPREAGSHKLVISTGGVETEITIQVN